MSEQNIVNVMVIPDVPKVLPGEQLYVYVPKASFTFPGIIAYNNTQFRIDGNFLFIREDYVSPGVRQKIDELKQYTDNELQLKQDKDDDNISLAQRPEQKSVVGAINDLGTLTQEAKNAADHAQTTADNATTLANTGISKAEQAQQTADHAQQAAETAQATADNATTLANTGISKADQAQTTANTAVDKANDAKATANEAIMKADGRATSIGFMTAQDAVTALNGYPRTQLKGGDTIWIVEEGTPDLWVTEVAETSVPYNYTTKDKFNQDLVDNKVLQIGYFKTAYQESDGKPVTIAWQNVLVKSTDWVASTEFADFPYEAKIELTDFVDYTTVPQVVFDIADTMSGNYAPICKSGDKCVYIYSKVQNEITLKTVITFAPNVNGASITGGGYNNRGKWQASTTYEIDDLVYTDNGQYVCIEGITSTTSPEQDTTHWQATFIATGKTKNRLTISGQDNGTGVQKTFDGSQAVEVSFDETTMTTKEVDGVLKVGAKGTIPEALPQTAGALKSGNLPIDGWNMFGEGWLQNSLPTSRAWRTVTYGGDKFVALAKDAAYGAYSTDGISWGEITLPASREWWTATYGNGKFVAIAQNSAYGAYSTDGITWTEMTLPASRVWQKVAYGDGKFVAVASSSDKGAYSTDGTNWTEMTFPASRAWYGVTYGNGKFVAVASGINKGAYSTDGITWTDMTLPASNMSDVTYGDGKFVAVGGNQSNNGAYSTDGINWIETTSSAGRSGSSVTYGDGKFVAISWDMQNATYSTDGIHWNAMTMPVRAYWATITYGNGKFVAVAQSSPKGAYWNAANAQVSYTISDTDVTVNSDVLMELTDEGMVKANALANGSIQVIRDRVPTIAIPYTYKVKQTNAAGQFTLVNHYIPDVPDVPDAPTALPQETSTIKSGKLPTSGWTMTGVRAFWQGSVDCPSDEYVFIGASKALADILYADDSAYMIVDYNYFYGGYYNKENAEFSYKKSNAKVNGLTGISFRAGYNDFEPTIFISRDGKMYGKGMWQSTGHYDVTYTSIGASTVSQQIYSISDSSITTNGDILMELTDEGRVKAYSMEAGKITVIRDTVPNAAIPYTYKVKQTNTSGQFTLVNHFVPTRTSQLENDSDFITKADIPFIPTRTSELENDSNFAKTTEANTWTGVQTFSNADGIKTDRVHNLDNNDAWYNFDGSNNRFGSPSRPTIIRTSEARPRAQVPSGETTVTKEIALLEDIANALYPVGSIYMSVNNVNPSTLFGGTWEAWGAGKVPVGVDTNDTNFATVEKTGGEKQHTLTIAEMPEHNHTIPCTPTANDGSEPTYQAAQVNAEATGNHNSIVAVSSGGGSPHNNLQPYITCYMWKRTA